MTLIGQRNPAVPEARTHRLFNPVRQSNRSEWRFLSLASTRVLNWYTIWEDDLGRSLTCFPISLTSRLLNVHWVSGLGLVLGFEMKNKVPGFKELSQDRGKQTIEPAGNQNWSASTKADEGVLGELREEHLRGWKFREAPRGATVKPVLGTIYRLKDSGWYS